MGDPQSLDYRPPEPRPKGATRSGRTSLVLGLCILPLAVIAPIFVVPATGIGFILGLYWTIASRGRSIAGLLGLIINGLFASELLWVVVTGR